MSRSRLSDDSTCFNKPEPSPKNQDTVSTVCRRDSPIETYSGLIDKNTVAFHLMISMSTPCCVLGSCRVSSYHDDNGRRHSEHQERTDPSPMLPSISLVFDVNVEMFPILLHGAFDVGGSIRHDYSAQYRSPSDRCSRSRLRASAMTGAIEIICKAGQSFGAPATVSVITTFFTASCISF